MQGSYAVVVALCLPGRGRSLVVPVDCYMVVSTFRNRTNLKFKAHRRSLVLKSGIVAVSCKFKCDIYSSIIQM